MKTETKFNILAIIGAIVFIVGFIYFSNILGGVFHKHNIAGITPLNTIDLNCFMGYCEYYLHGSFMNFVMYNIIFFFPYLVVTFLIWVCYYFSNVIIRGCK